MGYKILLILFYLVLYPILFSIFGSSCLDLAGSPELFRPLLIGLAIGGVAYHFILRRFYVIQTFEHELTHGIFALLLGGKITGFVVTRHDGGYCEYRNVRFGRVGKDLVGFAPYILPTFTLFSALFLPLFPEKFQFYFLIWIGFTFAYHTISTIEETKQSFNNRTFKMAGTGEETKSDLGRRGLFYSALSIVAFTLFFHLLVVVIITDGYAGLPDVFIELWEGMVSTVLLVYNFLSDLILGLINRFK